MDYNVIAIDIDDTVLAKAKEAGVEHIINSRKEHDLPNKIREITGKGADAVVVFTAVKAGYDLAPKTLRVGGRLIVVGCPPTDISLSALDISLGKYTIHGASNHATPAMLRECAEFTYQHGIESPSQFFKIDDIGEMIEIMQSGKMGGQRLVVKF